MTTDKQWTELMEEHELAYFRADLALSSPQSYSIAEKAEICDQMAASTAAVDAAMKAEFGALPEFAQHRLMEMLCVAYWAVVGFAPCAPGVVPALRGLHAGAAAFALLRCSG